MYGMYQMEDLVTTIGMLVWARLTCILLHLSATQLRWMVYLFINIDFFPFNLIFFIHKSQRLFDHLFKRLKFFIIWINLLLLVVTLTKKILRRLDWKWHGYITSFFFVGHMDILLLFLILLSIHFGIYGNKINQANYRRRNIPSNSLSLRCGFRFSWVLYITCWICTE
jgi:hypothetical protein